MNFLDALIMQVSPSRGLARIRARQAASILQRHFEAASTGRRTMHWSRRNTDPNAAYREAIRSLRVISRDLVRNNPWARRGVNIAANSAVGWGIVPALPAGRFADLWSEWADTTACDADGINTFCGLERLVFRTMVESGEVLVRRRQRLASDGLPLPLQLQVLEPDFLDHNLNGTAASINGSSLPATGNLIIQGVEFDAIGRRVAYHLFDNHPGAAVARSVRTGITKRVPASEILHVFRADRPGQVRGVPWLAPVILKLKDFDEYEDATIMRQKIASCFAAFVTDTDGAASPLGEESSNPDDDLSDTIEPGTIHHLPPGKSVEFGDPPSASDYDGLSKVILRGIAAGLGITYEALTGDYSNVNYSSGRLGRLEMANNVHEWQYDLAIPGFCDPAYQWAAASAVALGVRKVPMRTTWTPPPMAMIDPEKDTKAATAAVRAGQMTPSEMVRERGWDPVAFWREYANDLKTLDKLGIVLDSDSRQRTINGQAQSVGNAAGGASTDTPSA